MAALVDLLSQAQPSRMGMIEGDPEYDPWSMQAARVRARYPTPGGGILASNASRAGAVGFSDLPGYDEAKRQAGNVYAGEDYNPSSLVQMAMGAVGAPGMVGGVPGTVGSGIIRRPGAVEGVVPVLDPTIARQIQSLTRRKGGSTTSLAGDRPSEGLMMGIYQNAEPLQAPTANRAFVTDKPLSLLDLENFAQAHRQPLSGAERYLGTWRDPDTGKTYVDVAQRFTPEELRKATKFGERTGQISGWNLGEQQSFPVGNWWDFISGPEYHGRLRQMAEEGNQYLRQFPSKEWWDMHGSAFERVYGPQNLPQVAGYTASTAPNTAPMPNLQQMTEYMRRHIRGEPIVQPDWRVPEGTMTNTPGGMMPMESSRALNLERTQRGALNELSRAKVREEAAAMMGDPDAVVIDRHQVRLAEKPEAGIFANAQEDKINAQPPARGASDYDLLQAQIMDDAYGIGRTPRDHSADAWTGIRETIKKTGELFGQKHKGSAITGESKSYADQFDDLLDRKASFLRISKSDLEKRLRDGDTNLLSWLVATTPALASAYQQWRGQSGSSSSDRSQQSPGSQQTPADAL